MTQRTSNCQQPGDRLKHKIWQMALAPEGQLPMPTVERINTIKCLVASWKAIDAAAANDD